MSLPRIMVISTAFAPPAEARARCLASVAEQVGVELVEHWYYDAAWEIVDPPAHFDLLRGRINYQRDDEIIACVDGDDWLARPDALAIVAGYFERGALVTYGSFRFADGRAGNPSGAYAPGEDVRTAPWRGTHLKCFRAGLFKRIKREHMQDASGRWLEHARDMALMFPLLEMAGLERAAHVREEVYAYNYANSTEFRGSEAVRAAERECVTYVRGLPRYERLP